ncbi:MAG: glucose-6-phosphate isomerase, partial [Gaiellales bacterium]
MATSDRSAPAPLRERPAWQALEAHRAELGDVDLRALFAADPDRGERLALTAQGLYLDYSKSLTSDVTFELLIALAEECGIHERTRAMFSGERINTTEDRAVL